MGPTGAGKSAFIEALAGESQKLNISKDQLSGYTQEVTRYKLHGVEYSLNHTDVGNRPRPRNPRNYRRQARGPVYLIDTPGFCDSKISQIEIITSIKKWMQDNSLYFVDSVFYLQPITDTRITGSKKRIIEMLGPLIGDQCWSVTIITTMWDRLANQKARERAEANFNQLQKEVWQDIVINGAEYGQGTKFHNDQASALEIVSLVIGRGTRRVISFHPVTKVDAYTPYIYRDLLERILDARRQKRIWRDDLYQTRREDDEMNEELETILATKIQEYDADLTKFWTQFRDFGEAPSGFEEVAELIEYQMLVDEANEAREDVEDLEYRLAKLRSMVQPDEEKESTLVTQLSEAREKLQESSDSLKAYGEPPTDFGKEIHIPSATNRSDEGTRRTALDYDVLMLKALDLVKNEDEEPLKSDGNTVFNRRISYIRNLKKRQTPDWQALVDQLRDTLIELWKHAKALAKDRPMPTTFPNAIKWGLAWASRELGESVHAQPTFKDLLSRLLIKPVETKLEGRIAYVQLLDDFAKVKLKKERIELCLRQAQKQPPRGKSMEILQEEFDLATTEYTDMSCRVDSYAGNIPPDLPGVLEAVIPQFAKEVKRLRVNGSTFKPASSSSDNEQGVFFGHSEPFKRYSSPVEEDPSLISDAEGE
ncbi:hypothetical protein CVT24_000160 [Panaeolus cyanescens]|uniref:G domain-containing protein n=1 Tax=Panaeolus cyanescens TaxID=181874 RepID=A0A409VIW9_9AGAR|nr:hypothetical protein CVT24_000160 [Panaeolus cyanescens]